MSSTIPPATSSSALPEEAYAVALASVSGIGPKSLRALLQDATPRAAWDELVRGRVHLVASRQGGAVVGHARRTDVAALWEAHVRAGIGVYVLGQPEYPTVLADDPQAPAVLFFIGRPAVLDAAPRVAVVGTRSATRYGLGVAAQLGADLAAAGVVVVSGLALGIDGAAHEGAVAAWHAACGEALDGASSLGDIPRGSGRGEGRAAPPVAVVAGSVATPYPRQHARLWRRVANAGAVLSESPIGVADLAWRFPLRNRIIAAISDVVVVVECHVRGGSLHTVQAATARGVTVGAVPGSVRSPASAGTNDLIADGCFVVRDASDVLVAVGIASASTGRKSGDHPVSSGVGVDGLPFPTADVARAVGWDPTPLEEILGRTGLGMDAVCGALERLRARRLVHGEGGCWERV
ncbi:MAG: DNA-processing protein DprA [Acidimicrobiales bacterium]|jgi:DNA processing protein